jgi:hypothetical protein
MFFSAPLFFFLFALAFFFLCKLRFLSGSDTQKNPGCLDIVRGNA